MVGTQARSWERCRLQLLGADGSASALGRGCPCSPAGCCSPFITLATALTSVGALELLLSLAPNLSYLKGPTLFSAPYQSCSSVGGEPGTCCQLL